MRSDISSMFKRSINYSVFIAYESLTNLIPYATILNLSQINLIFLQI